MSDKKAMTVKDVLLAKGLRKLAMLTAYDAPTARWAARAGVDMILVGDSLGMAVQGKADTNGVSLDQMIYHASLVTAAAPEVMIIGDLPFMTYETGCEQALLNAGRYFREAGIRAVKLEGGKHVAPQVRALQQAGIPVMGHLGLTPQRAAVLGGFRAQAKSAKEAMNLWEDAKALQDAGCFALTLECVPAPVAAEITRRLTIPTIGIGAGPDCDGQVLVIHDILGLGEFTPRFVKVYAELGQLAEQAIAAYARDVRTSAFPEAQHSFTIADSEYQEWLSLLGDN